MIRQRLRRQLRDGGWNIYEGNHPYKGNGSTGNYVFPVAEYNHADGGCSITGGYVYRGTKYKELAGRYIYGDYDTGRLWSLKYDNGKVTQNRQLADTHTLMDHAAGNGACRQLNKCIRLTNPTVCCDVESRRSTAANSQTPYRRKSLSTRRRTGVTGILFRNVI
jgi:hypothetical protein